MLVARRLWGVVNMENVYSFALHNLAYCFGILGVCTQGGV